MTMTTMTTVYEGGGKYVGTEGRHHLIPGLSVLCLGPGQQRSLTYYLMIESRWLHITNFVEKHVIAMVTVGASEGEPGMSMS